MNPRIRLSLEPPMLIEQARLMWRLRNTYNALPEDSRERYEMIAEAVVEAATQNGIAPSLFICMVGVAVEGLTHVERD